ncbi:hypothetical protein BDK92_4085 [Micromonospora pisi]|uniref:Uncharacterized protein n=2 Tax=Micromonospora pisi TaxID=589240 RepID=A0A495JNW3_9ACTN|nr:hypothetical protein BDK92_4085 [Micromonospora pisi]
MAAGLVVTAPVFAAVPRAAVPRAAVAVAADVDLAVTLDGTTLTNQTQRKTATATVTNHGTATAQGVRLHFSGRVDGEVINPSSVAFCPASATPTPPTTAPSLEVTVGGECGLPDLAPGQTLRLTSTIVRSAHGTGQVGEVTVRVSHGGTDRVPANDSATASIGFAEGAGPDLYARAWDGPADRAGTLTPVPPGGSADLRFEIGNHGAESVSGMVVTIGLPNHVMFAEESAGCAYDAARRNATCTYPDLSLVSARADRASDDRSFSAVRFRHPVRISRSAPAPARLDGGRVEVEPLLAGQLPPSGRLPEGATGLVATETVGAADSDRFTMSTVTRAGAAAGLPLTGTPTGLLGGLGLGVLVVGGGLVLLARQRRLVPVLPAT